MHPIQHFHSVWERCEELVVLHGFLNDQLTAALRPDELLRAEWVARVSALDLYIHELVAQRMLAIFEGRVEAPQSHSKFVISSSALIRIRSAQTEVDASAAFDLEVRGRLSTLTFQDPEKIAEGIRYVSSVALWDEVALLSGATPATKNQVARDMKMNLSLIARRRNKIAHEGDLQPDIARTPWPINRTDLIVVRETIIKIVTAIDAIIFRENSGAGC